VQFVLFGLDNKQLDGCFNNNYETLDGRMHAVLHGRQLAVSRLPVPLQLPLNPMGQLDWQGWH